MAIQKTPGGTRGARVPSASGRFAQFLARRMQARHRRKGDRMMGMDLLYLSTVGAKTGERRQTPVAWFPDGDDAWLIVASNAGAARHPGWYHNIAAHPDQVSIEVGGRTLRVAAEQLTGERRDAALRRIVATQPRYGGYQGKTDRELPVLRLTPA